ncbi:hypothetical protein CC1G_02983 [Coprinopsis cinerea okayama7|uniref:DUF6534 domain-containing protein n=1 Tax=Coprinopsis cinerea (strain Okayama-7 / 130 / ATCC MYA-4618 / FGSC 9003) TaxID=240176 RepID=A8NRZ4_COPC7|nr:hypothetical protein CC1G_02983 [Coprinopsis cinerea okayama7\|eukprot:XP_001835895.2 hypothetical protein CC1G_02983 [Coprinopsis cinerea okayama7\
MAGEVALQGSPAEIAHGQMFIGFFINVLLCGIMITQVYLYGVTYKKDPVWIKIATAFLFAYLYRSLIKFYGIVEILNKADWIIIGLLAGAGGVAGIWTAFEVGRTPTFTEFQNFKATVIVWLAAEALCDILITGILVWYFDNTRPDSRIPTSLWIALFGHTVILPRLGKDAKHVNCTQPKGTHLIFNFPLAKLYTNSLMSSLNSRKGWNFHTKDQNKTILESEHGLSSGTGQGSQGAVSKQRMSLQQDVRSVGVASRPEIFVHVESHELVDVPNGHQTVLPISIGNRRPGDASTHSSLEASDNEKRQWNHPYYAAEILKDNSRGLPDHGGRIWLRAIRFSLLAPGSPLLECGCTVKKFASVRDF